MAHDVEMAGIANATTELDEYDEIVVTPEMISAGIHEFVTGDPRYESNEELVERIYIAMVRCSSRGNG